MSGSPLGPGSPHPASNTVFETGVDTASVIRDGRWVPRGEPFVKLFPRGLEVCDRVGDAAFCTLLAVALVTRLDSRGRLVCELTAEEIARLRGVNRSTVANHLSRLSREGFLVHERDKGPRGTFVGGRYIVQPSAGIDRFGALAGEPLSEKQTQATASPLSREPDAGRADSAEGAASACTEPVSVSPTVAETDPGSARQPLQDAVLLHAEDVDELASQLERAGIANPIARRLVNDHEPELLRRQLRWHRERLRRGAVANPAGLLVSAIRENWERPPGAEAQSVAGARRGGGAADDPAADVGVHEELQARPGSRDAESRDRGDEAWAALGGQEQERRIERAAAKLARELSESPFLRELLPGGTSRPAWLSVQAETLARSELERELETSTTDRSASLPAPTRVRRQASG